MSRYAVGELFNKKQYFHVSAAPSFLLGMLFPISAAELIYSNTAKKMLPTRM